MRKRTLTPIFWTPIFLPLFLTPLFPIYAASCGAFTSETLAEAPCYLLGRIKLFVESGGREPGGGVALVCGQVGGAFECGDGRHPKWSRYVNDYQTPSSNVLSVGIKQNDLCIKPEDVLAVFGSGFVRRTSNADLRHAEFYRYEGSKVDIMQYSIGMSMVQFGFYNSSCLFDFAIKAEK